MPKFQGVQPLHILYSPAHRKQEHPDKAWTFLLCVARNTAAAFAGIHKHGHVIGDVNQGNVLVGNDGKVVLIDTDSFQIDARGTTHLCQVGVSHFTPPELQGVASFDERPRSPNHDNFGLALLIFHLLFGGRHPYSGVPLTPQAGDSIEKDIQAFRYAYASDGQRRGVAPPPQSIRVSVVPDAIQAMFTFAFTENGAVTSRPTAHQWVTALDDLLRQVKQCSTTRMHTYPGHLLRCPWCELEDQGIVYFLDVSDGAREGANGTFVLAKVWAVIESVPPPKTVAIPNIQSIAVTPAPLPPGISDAGTIFAWRAVIAVVAIGLLAIVPVAFWLILGGAFVAWIVVGNFGEEERRLERKKRRAALDVAEQGYEQILSRIRIEASPDAFLKKREYLVQLRNELLRLPEREKTDIDNLHRTAEARQKHQFLERHFIDDASIHGVGPAKKAALRSFGIETAADITWARVIAVKGFGEVLTRSIVNWRVTCEKTFVFNPNLTLTEADKNAVRLKIATRKREIEMALTSGASELQRLRNEVCGKSNVLGPSLQTASKTLAQARADYNLIA